MGSDGEDWIKKRRFMKQIVEHLKKYLYFILPLFIAFGLLTCFEVLFSSANNSSGIVSVFYKLSNDFWTVAIILGLLLPIYLLLGWFSEKTRTFVFLLLLSLFVVGQFALVKYFMTTLINLGADILGYSFDDIFLTVSASEGISFVYFLPFLIFPIIFIASFLWVKKYVASKTNSYIAIALVLFFGAILLVSQKTKEQENQNKLYFFVSDIVKLKIEKKQLGALNFSNRKDYPLLKPSEEIADVLSPFFNIDKSKKPNIVILMVEGLGTEFVGNHSYAGFTPYLDSMISKSLFWENFVSNTGRTFGVAPSLLASLPLGEKGFLEEAKTASHISLLSVLKNNGYTTSYYSGDAASFDKKINFLEYNGVDYLVDQDSYGADYQKTASNEGGFSWGYPDAEIYRKMLNTLDAKKEPRLDVLMTLSNHEPFAFPDKENYLSKVDSILENNSNLKISSDAVLENKDIYATLLYTDTSLKNFMKAYEKRPDFQNTIFLITGDHRLIPINQKDKLCRFHVPLYMYSPMLKKAVKFKSVSSHWDVTPSLLSFLMNNYNLNQIEAVPWMSTGLDTVQEFRNTHQIPMMRYKGSINDFLYKDYLLSDGALYQVKENFGIYKIKNDSILKEAKAALTKFKILNKYVTQENRIFPDSLNIYRVLKEEIPKEKLAIIKKEVGGMNYDDVFFVARDSAFAKRYEKARLLCDYILNEFPNYADVRTLKGRTYAWQGLYDEAEESFLTVIKRTPFYEDSYGALVDLYWWSNQDEKSIPLFQTALQRKLKNPGLVVKMAKVYQRLKKVDKSISLLDSIIQIYPDSTAYKTLKNTLK
jgi:phosphoglycerol transferase MdoB-like AlkP superfamily enzyme